jgi:hypothetical protein
MKFIRDNDLGGLAMIPLFVDWQICRCNVKECTNVPTTIVSHEDLVFGICEDHYKQFSQKGEIECTLTFDDFNAFAHDVKTKSINEKGEQT